MELFTAVKEKSKRSVISHQRSALLIKTNEPLAKLVILSS
jgi:hypothetical protein